MGQIAHTVILLITFVSNAFAQQIPNRYMPITWPHLSSSCRSNMNRTVQCPPFLPDITLENPRLPPEQLDALCGGSCYLSLLSASFNLRSACRNDIIEHEGSWYPATFLLDSYLRTHKLSCRKDPVTNEYCDTLRISWLNEDPPNPSNACSDCVLGSIADDLGTPMGFDLEYEQQFSSLTSSCSKFDYSYFVAPTPYTRTPISTSLAAPQVTPSCRASHTVVDGETCGSIALQYGVSSFSLAQLNSLTPSCQLLATGMELCIGAQCDTRVVEPEDTCAAIVSSSGSVMTGQQFLAWNPHIDPLCSNLHDLPDAIVCVSPPGGGQPATQPTVTLAPSTAISPVPKPTNAHPQSNERCGRWYTVQIGDNCNMISVIFSIQLSDFYFLNPSIDSVCSNLWLHTTYCVWPVGDIHTYPAYPIASSVSLPYSLTSETFTTDTWSTVAPAITANPIEPVKPLAPGSWGNCSRYASARERPHIVDQFLESNARDIAWDATDYYCNNIANAWALSLDTFLMWNPSLVNGQTNGNCTLLPEFRYCVANPGSAIIPPVDSICHEVEPADVKAGTSADCSCFTLIFGLDISSYSCDALLGDYDITLSQLQAWNSWIGPDCDQGIFSGLTENNDNLEFNAVCIRSNGTSTPTSSAPPSATSSAPPTQTQPGIPAGCTTYHTAVSGDTCYDIMVRYQLDTATFYSWNPPVGEDCGGLWLGYSYCVAGGPN